MPCVGYFYDFGILAAPGKRDESLELVAEISQSHRVRLEKAKSEAGAKLDFLGITISFVGLNPRNVSGALHSNWWSS